MPKTTFYGASTYKTQFGPKEILVDAKKKKPLEDYQAPFYGQTTSLESFQDWGVSPQSKASPIYVVIKQPFHGTSTYHDDFQPKTPQQRERRTKTPEKESYHRDNYTTYSVDYVPLPFFKTAAKLCCDNVRHTACATCRE